MSFSTFSKPRKPWKSARKEMKRSGFQSKGSGLKTTTGLKTRTTLTAKKPMNKVGRVGRANIAANKQIRSYSEKNGLDSCESVPLQLEGLKGIECLGKFTVANAHKHKRAYYKGDAEKLADPKQWVKACVNCHDAIEHNKELTDAVFNSLRP